MLLKESNHNTSVYETSNEKLQNFKWAGTDADVERLNILSLEGQTTSNAYLKKEVGRKWQINFG